MRVIANKTPHEVEAKPLTMLYHPGGMKVDAPNAVRLTPQMTVEYCEQHLTAERYEHIRNSTLYQKLFALAWDDPAAKMPESLDALRYGPDDIKHIIGLMIHCYRFAYDRTPVFLVRPETHLHPKQQCGLADMLIFLLNMFKGYQFDRERQQS